MKNFLTHYLQILLARLSGQPVLQRLRRRFPKISSFLINRFDTTSFIGLPLTLLLIVILVNVSLLSSLTEAVVESEAVVLIDQNVTDFLFKSRNSWLSQILFGITQLGTREAVYTLGGLATLVFLYKRRYMAVLAFWLTMAGVGLSVKYGKIIISRDRPDQTLAFYPEQNFSFPSGHSTTAMALFGMLTYLTYWRLHSKRERRALLFCLVMLVLLVGFSRIYLRVHFLSDVLAGILLGAFWVLLGISIMETLTYYQHPKRTSKQSQDH